MNAPTDLKYTRSDEWVRLQGEVATIGITDYAQHELGELVYVEVPALGTSLQQEAAFGVVESVKAVSELLAPLNGTVVAANEELADSPALVNDSPYEAGWLVQVQLDGPLPLDLLTSQEYIAYRSH